MMNSKISLKVKAAAELERRRRQRSKMASLPSEWRERVTALFSPYFNYGFSQPHIDMWEWADGIDKESSPRPIIAIWSRGRGKSTTAEAIVADLGIRNSRGYCMYVSGTQEQADKHVQTIARMLESDNVAKYAPRLGRPRLTRNGNRAWNRQMLQAETGFTVESIGLNKAVRGQKIDWARPDLIIFDDVDEKHDTELTTRKKLDIVSTSILPASSSNVAVMFVQNLIHADSIASMLSKPAGQPGAASFLMNRIVSGPFPAVENLEYKLVPDGDVYRWKIIEGTSLWEGFDIDVCEFELNLVGPSSFELESQHDVDRDEPDALMNSEVFEQTRVTDCPDLEYVGIAVDPPGGATECGIVAGGKTMINGNWHGYTIEDSTQLAGTLPNEWAKEVLRSYIRNKADVVFVETNFGGDMVIETIRQAKLLDGEDVVLDGSQIAIQKVFASRGKAVRAQPIATAFQQGRIHHVGQFSRLEREWRQFVPGVTKDSPNRLDAEVWLFTGLGLAGDGKLVLFGD